MMDIYIYIYIQHLLPSLATICDPMPHTKVLGNNQKLVSVRRVRIATGHTGLACGATWFSQPAR